MSRDMAAGTLWCIFVCAVIALLIGGLVSDLGGRDVGKDHNTPVPPGVTLLAADAYLVRDIALLPEVCGGSGFYGKPDAVASQEGVYVQCVEPQRWNDSREVSPNYGTGLVRTATSVWYLGIFGALVGLWAVTGLLAAMVTSVSGSIHRGRRRRARRITQDDELEALAVAHAKNRITLEEHEAAVKRIFEKDDGE